ncbi:MAG: 50S ribosomal protein L11 methyltransferase [Cyclobacteriaceae bacterium]
MSSVNFKALHIACSEEFTEILMAELSMLPFDTFEETSTGLSAFSDESLFDETGVNQILERYKSSITNVRIEIIERENWNEEWEKNYDPVVVDDKIIVKATFHQIERTYPFEITISPKMSFGTGHHATTHLMLKAQLDIDHQNKRVYDLGTGTGVLAIMASKLGATDILATDVDDWCIENSLENFALNGLKAPVLKGPIKVLGIEQQADIILANINKNILLDEMVNYVRLLSDGGYLLLSGFYVEDVQDLTTVAEKMGLTSQGQSDRDNWAILVFRKQSL